MFYKRGSLLATVILLLLCTANAQQATVLEARAQQQRMAALIKENFSYADSQYRVMMKSLPDGKMPQTYSSKKDSVVGYERTWWCTGFYPGALWYIYEQTKDTVIRKEAERALSVIQPNQTYTGNHDLGFMMYCSFGNAYRITGDTACKQVLFRSAQSLATRFRPGIPAIQSWNRSKKFTCPVIIDNMMNLELLEWVSANGGETRYAAMARQHANTTLHNHFRADYSSYHVIDYNPETGEVLQKRTFQGYSDSSAWARGQGWGLYGYTMMYRFTKNTVYLNQARHIAAFILNHPHLPEDKVPYWDFNDPKLPDAPRDASAAALIASALLELGQYTSGKEKEKYIADAVTMLQSLSGKAYRTPSGTSGGFLLLHSTGAFPFASEVDVPLIYADYYFLEALKRYKDWYL